MTIRNRLYRKILVAVASPLVSAVIIYASACNPKSEAVAVSEPGVAVPSAEDATAKKHMKICASVEVRSVGVSTEFYKEGLSFDDSPAISTAPKAAGGELIITAVGPVLGSMDSQNVKTDLACTPKGFALTATVTRSADYQGASAKNVLWRPRIIITVVLREPEITFEGRWKMRLTTGEELEHAQTPPYPDTQYPLTLTKILRREEPPR